MKGRARIVAIFFTLIAYFIFSLFVEKFFAFSPTFKSLSLLFFGSLFLYLLRQELIYRINTQISDSTLQFHLEVLVNFLFAIFLIGLVLYVLGASVSSIATFLGIASAGLAIAMQQPILNLAGYVTLVMSRMYVKGDYIKIQNITGRVIDVTMMHTKLLEFDERTIPKGTHVTIPNSFILTSPVINYSKPRDTIWERFTISLTYETNLKRALRKLERIVVKGWKKFMEERKDFISSSAKRLAEKIGPSFVFRSEFASSSIDITILFEVPLEIRNSLRSYLINEVFLNLPEKDIEFAYPHTEVIFRKKK